MQLQGATKLERELYDVCLLWEQQPASEFQTRVVMAMSDASAELQRLRMRNEESSKIIAGLVAKGAAAMETVGTIEMELNQLAELLADSGEITVDETPAVKKLNEIIESLPTVETICQRTGTTIEALRWAYNCRDDHEFETLLQGIIPPLPRQRIPGAHQYNS